MINNGWVFRLKANDTTGNVPKPIVYLYVSGTGTYPMTESFAPTKDSWRYIWSCDGEGTMSVFIMSVGSKVPAS